MQQHPVILLIDNDSRCQSRFTMQLRKFGKQKPTGQEVFVHITGISIWLRRPIAAGQKIIECTLKTPSELCPEY